MKYVKILGVLLFGTILVAGIASDSEPSYSQSQEITRPLTSEAKNSNEEIPIQKKPEYIPPTQKPVTKSVETQTSNCHPSYSGCLKMDAGDYDCAGGSGNGPNYTGTVRVYGSDPFGLDRDNDGLGCE